MDIPWDIPLTIEKTDASETALLLKGLYRIGMGCQVMDDMVDIISDLERKRHNFLVSLIYYGPRPEEQSRLQKLLVAANGQPSAVNPALEFPDSMLTAFETANEFLESGLNLLFSEQHRFLVKPSIQFLGKRIGAANIFRNQANEI